MSVDEPGRWMRLDPLDKIREEGDGGLDAAIGGGAPLPSPPLSLVGTTEDEETVYGRCSKRERPSIRKSEKHDSIM